MDAPIAVANISSKYQLLAAQYVMKAQKQHEYRCKRCTIPSLRLFNVTWRLLTLHQVSKLKFQLHGGTDEGSETPACASSWNAPFVFKCIRPPFNCLLSKGWCIKKTTILRVFFPNTLNSESNPAWGFQILGKWSCFLHVTPDNFSSWLLPSAVFICPAAAHNYQTVRRHCCRALSWSACMLMSLVCFCCLFPSCSLSRLPPRCRLPVQESRLSATSALPLCVLHCSHDTRKARVWTH